ncbi:hypothetical protein DFH07DRAFT_888612 [Mycena maculata]|uniref:Uncharacterized protein n=1 Tax=Mycena maculata TaxID=230809 RepID=A0AAD7IS38_9AGAR|nr:hypothetical protein DFH07DRAFT_888612 [Mycena maculata]
MVKGTDVLLIFVAILFPPAAAAFITGCSCDLLINILLTLLGYIPGHIHAFWLIYKKMKAEERYGAGGFRYTGNGTYEPLAQQPAQPQAYYGATAN